MEGEYKFAPSKVYVPSILRPIFGIEIVFEGSFTLVGELPFLVL
jgi:hypothetical protein